MTDVVVDTNAMLLPVTDGTDLEEELTSLLGEVRIVVPSSVLRELRLLSSRLGKAGRAAGTALGLAHRFATLETDMPGDDGILDIARRLSAVVVTNDKTLQGEVHRSGLTVIASRGKGRLHIVGG